MEQSAGSKGPDPRCNAKLPLSVWKLHVLIAPERPHETSLSKHSEQSRVPVEHTDHLFVCALRGEVGEVHHHVVHGAAAALAREPNGEDSAEGLQTIEIRGIIYRYNILHRYYIIHRYNIIHRYYI